MEATNNPQAPRGLGHLQRQTMKRLEAAEYGLTAPQIAKALRIPESSARRALRSLAARGMATSYDPPRARNRLWITAQGAE